MTAIGFEEEGLRDILEQKAATGYLRYVTERTYGQGRVIYTVECRASGGKVDFTGYYARLIPEGSREAVSQFFRCMNDYSDFHLREAYHLLCGRAVIKFRMVGEGPQVFIGEWNVLDNGQIRVVEDFDLREQLQQLPLVSGLGGEDGFRIIYGLIRGEVVTAELKNGTQTISACLIADPRQKSVRVVDSEGKPIRLHLQTGTHKPDPDNELKRKKTTTTKHRPGKGLKL